MKEVSEREREREREREKERETESKKGWEIVRGKHVQNKGSDAMSVLVQQYG